jgi:hypothetical protein
LHVAPLKQKERQMKKEVQKLKAEEEAAQKAELARFLIMKRQQRFWERERLKKARDKENHETGSIPPIGMIS